MNKQISTGAGIAAVVAVAIVAGAVMWFALAPQTQAPAQVLPDSKVNSTEGQVKNVPSGWKTYKNSQHRFSFNYPSNLTAEDVSDPGDFHLDILSKDGWMGEIFYTDSEFYNPPSGADVKEWVVDKNDTRFENLGGGEFSNKIGKEFQVDNLPTLHLMNKSYSGGIDDELYFIKKGKLYTITLSTENPGLEDVNSWQVKLLKSFKFF